MENQDPKKESLYPSEKVVLEELRQQRGYQNNTIDALDRKLATLFGANGTIITIVLAVLGIAKIDFKWVLIFSPAIVLLLLGFVFAVLAFWPRTWLYNPSPKALLEDYLMRKPSTEDEDSQPGSISQICADIREAYEYNEKALKGKSSLFKLSLGFEGSGMILFVIYLIIYSLIGG